MSEADAQSAARRRESAETIWSVTAAAAVYSIGLALAGRIPGQTPAYVPVLVSTALLAMNVAALWLAIGNSGTDRACSGPMAAGLVLIGPCLAGFAWTAPGAVLPLVWMPLLSVGAVVGWIVWRGLDHSPQRLTVAAPVDVDPRQERPASLPAVGELPAAGCADAGPTIAAAEAMEADVSQRLVRRETAAGEAIELTLRVTFEAGQRQLSVHVPISPPLAGVPQVECEPLDDAEVELSVGAVHPHGVRIDVRRPAEGASRQQLLIGIGLTCERRRQAA